VSSSGQLDWTLELTNRSSQTVRYDFVSSCQFNFKVFRGAELIWDDSLQQICLTALTSIILEPGESRFRTGSWEVRDANGGVPPGPYEARGELLTEPRVESRSVPFRVQG